MRIDQWLHAVRITKTRADAAKACRGGHVTINGDPAKPASTVKVGDHVEARVNQRQRIVDVTKVITKRVGAAAPSSASTITARHHPSATRSRHCSLYAIAERVAPRNATAARSTASAVAVADHAGPSRSQRLPAMSRNTATRP